MFYIFQCLRGWWVDWSLYFPGLDNLCFAFIWEPVWVSFRLVHCRILFKTPVAKCFDSARAMAVIHRVLIFSNCLWCPFNNKHTMNHAAFLLCFSCIREGCVSWMWPFMYNFKTNTLFIDPCLTQMMTWMSIYTFGARLDT